jgi:hypothetical protein
VDPASFKVNGAVYVTCTDSAGNMYVGGHFTSVGGVPVSNLFRMRPDATFDPTFTPNVLGTVYCLAASDTSLFIGGSITNIEGETRNNFGVISLQTGLVTECDPNVNGPVYACALDVPSGTIIIGGDFDAVGTFTPPYLARIYIASGLVVGSAAVPWTATPNIDGPVYDVELTEYRCYVAGDFAWAGNIPRRALAVLLKSDGTLLPADAQLDGPVYVLNRVDTTWYVGGSFSTLDGQPRSNIAHVSWDLHAKPWNPGTNGAVRTLHFIDHDRLFVGGDFSLFGNDTCSSGAIAHLNTSVLTPWDPTFNGLVYTAICDSAQRLYVGGEFFGAGGERRNNLCAISLNTGKVTEWNPDVNAPVSTLTLAGDSLYFAGDFTSVAATARARIAAIDLNSGTVLPFNPGTNGVVRTIAVTNTEVYVGGTFTSAGGQGRNNIAKLNKTTGAALNWNAGSLGTVNAILATPGWIYVAGFYSTIGTQQRSNLARVHPGTGLADLNWICDTDEGIYHADFYNGKLVIGGWFSTVNGQPAADFAMVDTITLQTQPLNFTTDGFVRTFTRSGDDFFVSGMFGLVNSAYQPNLISYDEGDAAVDTWTPYPDQPPVTMQATPTRLFIGGSMYSIAGRAHPYFQVLPVQWVTSVEETQTTVANTFTVFPNPSSDMITVSNAESFSRYVLTDITGQIVLSGTVNTSSLELSLAGLSAGVYVLTLSGDVVAPASQTVIRQ